MTSTRDSTQEEDIFKPPYPLRVRISVFLCPFGVIAGIFFIYLAIASQAVFPRTIYAIIFGFTVLSMPMIIFRKFRFGETIILKRYFLKSQIIHYEVMTDFTMRGLGARHGVIPLANVQNRSEFEKIICHLVARHKITLQK